MFSFGSPFGYDYYRPKQSSFSLFDDDPFSSGYYVREPTLFRSSSFRQPTRSVQQQRRQLSEDEDEYDPFSELFSLGARSRKDVKKSDEVKNQVNNSEDKIDRQTKSASTESNKSSIKQQQDKELDSQRFDTDNEIIFKFTNYICENPSNVNVSITKDGYIVLKTDGYYWKNKLPDNVEVEKASCTCVKKCLSLRLPKKVINDEKMEVQNDNKVVKNDVADKVMNGSDNNKDDVDKNENVKQQMEIEQVKNETSKEDEEIDPFAPIVEDIIEDDM